jgi:DNA-binding NtrC family response regulator
MPPLREHKEDILLMARHFLSYYAFETRRPTPALSREAERALVAHDWPGNVRELRNLMERLVILGSGETIELSDLPDGFGASGGVAAAPVSPSPTGLSASFKKAKQGAVMAFEKRYLESLMRRNEGNISRSAEEAGVERRNFQRLLKKYNIASEAFRDGDARNLSANTDK